MNIMTRQNLTRNDNIFNSTLKQINSLAPARCSRNFKSIIFKLLTVKLLSGECHRKLLTRSQYWFRQWLGAVRQQTITWANVDPVLYCYMVSPGHNGLTHWGRDKMDAISQTTCSSAFSWMKMFEFRLKFHWSLFLRVQLTIIQLCFR